MNNLTDLLNLSFSSIFSLVANGIMLILVYQSLWFCVRLHQRKKLFIANNAKQELPELKRSIQRSTLIDPSLSLEERIFTTIAESDTNKLEALRNIATSTGMLFTTLGIVLFGLSLESSSLESVMRLFGAALTTTALGGLAAMICTYALDIQITGFVREAVNTFSEDRHMARKKEKEFSQSERGKNRQDASEATGQYQHVEQATVTLQSTATQPSQDTPNQKSYSNVEDTARECANNLHTSKSAHS